MQCHTHVLDTAHRKNGIIPTRSFKRANDATKTNLLRAVCTSYTSTTGRPPRCFHSISYGRCLLLRSSVNFNNYELLYHVHVDCLFFVYIFLLLNMYPLAAYMSAYFSTTKSLFVLFFGRHVLASIPVLYRIRPCSYCLYRHIAELIR